MINDKQQQTPGLKFGAVVKTSPKLVISIPIYDPFLWRMLLSIVFFFALL